MQTRTVTLAAVLAVLLLAVAAVASGCGSASSSDDGVAALDDTTATTSGEDEQDGDATEEDPEEAALEWAECMRENGVDVPDPQVDTEDGGARITIRPGSGARRLDRIDSEKFQAAQKKCGLPFGRSGRPVLSAEEREEMQETMLEFAQCMREHGVDMPDPDFSGSGGGVIVQGGGPGRFDRDSETFRKAQQACDEILEDAMPKRVGAGASTSDGDGK